MNQGASSEDQKTREDFTNNTFQPYKPSLIDDFNRWVEGLPVNIWVFHLCLGLVLIIIHVAFLWIDDGLLSVEIFPIIIFNSLAIPYLFVLIYLTDKQAVNSLQTLRPVLNLTQAEFEANQYRLSNMPFLPPLLAGLLIMVITILLPSITISPERYGVLEELPVFSIVFHVLDKSSAFLFGVFIYHTIRQLRLVNSINKGIVHINLFNLAPLQSFSRLTGITAIGLLVFIYPWMLINPELWLDPILFANIALYSIIAIVVFIWPLWGVHRIIDQEKRRELLQIDLRMEAVLSNFNQYVDNGDYAQSEKIHGTITSLDIQQKRINNIPTWPWRPETGRLVLTAIALPLMLMLLQYFILQALD